MKKLLTFIALCLGINAAAQDFFIDFSRVGYMWGEKEIPNYENKIVLNAPADGADATAMIQEALDNVEAPGAAARTTPQVKTVYFLMMRNRQSSNQSIWKTHQYNSKENWQSFHC